MRILLVEPPVTPFDVTTKVFTLPPPYHLEILAGRLLPHHDVRILDMRLDNQLEAEMSSFKPDLVGCSCVAANSRLTKQLLKGIKRSSPEIITVVGGHHPSLMPEDCNEPFIDVVVIGEGEDALFEIAAAHEGGRGRADIAGIAYRHEDGTFRINRPRELMDLDQMPVPARNLTRHYRDKRLYFRANWRPLESTITSRGCPNKCTFCGLWKINRGKYRARSPRLIADELETITAESIQFMDDNSLDHTENSYALVQEIRRRGIKKRYQLYGRADTIVKHPDLIERWGDIGMKLLLVGLEAIDDTSLQHMNKKTTTETNRRAIEICHANHIEVVAFLIVNPDFDRADFARVSEYVDRNNLTHPVFSILSPFPGTDFYDTVKHTFITKGFELLDFFRTVLPTKLPLDEFYEEFLGLYRRAYPFSKFIKAILHQKAMLSPKTISINFKLRKGMASLRSHHDLVSAMPHD